MIRGRTSIGVLGVLAAAALFSTSGTSKALLAPEAWPPSVAAVRLLVGAVGMVAFVLYRGWHEEFVGLLRRPLVWLMAVGVAGYQAFFFVGIERTGVAVGTVVALGAAPLLAGLLGWVVGEGAPGWLWLGATAVAVCGLVLLTGGGSADTLGVISALLAAGSYAIYTVLGAKLARDGHPSSVVMAAPFALGALLLVPLLPAAGWVLSPGGIVLALWLGLAATSLAYILFGLGLPVLQPGHIATLTLLEPVGATLLGVVVLGETLSATGWLGAGLVLVGLAVVGLRDRA
ncbi:MAG: DMT family transporter [Actinobacteria bacterium]|nr:DMT family transporter [Actinomycetota bacterium]MCB8996712.1 DMT family transporter [Actinomycetota bacterium]MCB9415099.1 DMT family transporter [Actinomycetota bacterium]